jgi:hypothetical protein
METSNKLTGEQLSLWTSSAADTHVNHLAQQESEKEQMTQDTFGHGLEQPLASYDPDTQSWRMSEDISLWGEFKLLENLPKSGMTRSGVLYQQPAWVRPIDANESSLWPTPTTQEVEHPQAELTETGRRKSKNGKTSHSLGLADAVKMWPTPTAVTRPMEGNVRMYRAKIQAGEMTEAEAEAILGKSVWEAQGKVPEMWPTPVSSSSMAEDISTVQERLKNGKPYKSRLIEAVAMWPTPTTVDTFTPKSRSNPTLGDAARKSEDSNGKLNPTWVEWLMGFPIGWTDLKD